MKAICTITFTEDFTIDKIYDLTDKGLIDDNNNVWEFYLHGPHDNHLDNFNKGYGGAQMGHILN